jgi:hypothetical protein
MMKRVAAALIAGLLVAVLGGCAASGPSDAQLAAKYKQAVASLPHVASVDSSYKTAAGMGRTGSVQITADTSDDAELLALLKQAFPAIVHAADGDPQVGLEILVVASDGSGGYGPSALGYSGGGTLTSYRDFLKAHPEL